MEFSKLSPGERVKVEWPTQKVKAGEGYCPGGVVVQVTLRLIAIKSPGGYIFCGGVYHVGARVDPILRRVK